VTYFSGCVSLQTVIKVVYSLYEVHRGVQTTAARRSGRFNKMHEFLRDLHVSQQCLYESHPQRIEKEQWLSNNSPSLNTMEISCLGFRNSLTRVRKG